MDNALLVFLLPAIDEGIHSVLQLSFAVLFAGVLVLVPRAVALSARPDQWERRVAHGQAYTSADDLANAAATPAERWADIMPSLLLVFGLLGTFIGLGLALTEAAGALAPGADALAKLTELMDSLGSKFKTSTWGILAFLGLKVWFTRQPYDEWRQSWAAARLQHTAHEAAAQERQRRADERGELVEAIARIGDGLQASQAQAREQHTAQLAALQAQLGHQERFGKRQLDQAQLQLSLLNQLCEHGAGTAERMLTVADHAAASRIAMEEFSHNVRDNIENMASAAAGMATAAGAAGSASMALGNAVGEFRTTMSSVLGEVKSELGQSIDAMGQGFALNMQEMSRNLKQATDGIETAIAGLSQGVNTTITQLQATSDAAAERHEKAQVNFTNSGDALTANLNKMGFLMDQVKAQVEKGLTAVSASSARVLALDKHLEARTARDQELLTAMQQVAAHLSGTQSALVPVPDIANHIATLAAAVQSQHASQQASDRRQQRQLDDNAGLAASIAELGSAIAAMSRARLQAEQDAGHDPRPEAPVREPQ